MEIAQRQLRVRKSLIWKGSWSSHYRNMKRPRHLMSCKSKKILLDVQTEIDNLYAKVKDISLDSQNEP